MSELLLYAARKCSAPPGQDRRFPGREIVEMVAADEHVPADEARAMLRDALATLGGTEVYTWYDSAEIIYVIPAGAIDAS